MTVYLSCSRTGVQGAGLKKKQTKQTDPGVCLLNLSPSRWFTYRGSTLMLAAGGEKFPPVLLSSCVAEIKKKKGRDASSLSLHLDGRRFSAEAAAAAADAAAAAAAATRLPAAV